MHQGTVSVRALNFPEEQSDNIIENRNNVSGPSNVFLGEAWNLQQAFPKSRKRPYDFCIICGALSEPQGAHCNDNTKTA